MNNCKICRNETKKIFSKTVLQKYNADYFKCSVCGFVQTSEPVWIKEAYHSAITALDIGLISRNLYLKTSISKMIDVLFPESSLMLDYGGGYGMFVRMMRDSGYNFYRQDIYCENLFAVNFDIEDIPNRKFDLLTSFEVFEHLVDPMKEIEKMFAYSDTLIFSTNLYPESISDFEKWWYVSPLTGQHIAFYNRQTLEYIAQKFNKQMYTNGNNLHLFTSKKLSADLVTEAFDSKKLTVLNRIINKFSPAKSNKSPRVSLTEADYKMIENKLVRKD
jgi:2-polyprenyl-3-methyl-5-hydroxy-6-metoxy-1,4-benzoquinol methylase